jgi:hypothetical protein
MLIPLQIEAQNEPSSRDYTLIKWTLGIMIVQIWIVRRHLEKWWVVGQRLVLFILWQGVALI